MELTTWIGSARKYRQHRHIVSSFWLPLHWIWTMYPSFHTLSYKKVILVSARRELWNSIHCGSDPKWWISRISAMLFLDDRIIWHLTISTGVQSWYWFWACSYNIGHFLSIPLSRSPWCVPQMLLNKYCFAEWQCSSASPFSSSMGLQLKLLQCIMFQNLPSPSCLHSQMAICYTDRASVVCP
jgi:hypothetical protein